MNLYLYALTHVHTCAELKQQEFVHITHTHILYAYIHTISGLNKRFTIKSKTISFKSVSSPLNIVCAVIFTTFPYKYR